MLYLVLFAVLALGFYAATTMSVQVSRNERDTAEALRAAESGLGYFRYHLNRVSIPPDKTGTAVVDALLTDLRAALENTNNLGARTLSKSGTDTVLVPAIDLGGGASFSASIKWVEPNLTVSVTGSAGGIQTASRAVSIKYTRQPRVGDPPSGPPPQKSVMSYGIASKGTVQVKSSPSTSVTGTPSAAAGILSASTASPSIVTGRGAIGGDLGVVTAKSQVSLGGGTVAGESNAATIISDHVQVVPPPEFPTVDTTVFKPYATNVYASGASYYKNVRVPPNTNPRFNGGDVIEGILYIESPNSVTFRGHATVRGVIVFEQKNGVAQNSLDFRGNVSPAAIPNTAEFAGIRSVAQGLSIVAPTASVTMSGSTDGTMGGSMIAAKVSLAGSADLYFENGSIISLGPDPTEIEGKTVKFNGTGADNPPTGGGVTLPAPPAPPPPDSRFLPDPMSYLEGGQ